MLKKIAHYLHSIPLLSRLLTKNGAPETDTILSARMTNNRLQALEGHGYRQCYMEKLREVVHEQEPGEANKEHWFGEQGAVASEPVAGHGQGKARKSSTRLSQARITSTRLQAYQDTIAGRAALGEAGAIDEIDAHDELS